MGAVGEAEERSLPRREGLQEAPHPRDGSTECSVKAGISQQLNHTLQPALASWADPSPRADWVFTDIVSRVPGEETQDVWNCSTHSQADLRHSPDSEERGLVKEDTTPELVLSFLIYSFKMKMLDQGRSRFPRPPPSPQSQWSVSACTTLPFLSVADQGA